MNSYLALKCRSEQQVMNEFTKSIASKDYTKKTAILLQELTFFYVSINTDIDSSSANINDAVLKDLMTLLTHIKDKKEDQRIVKTIMTLLQRIAEQMLYFQALKNLPTILTKPQPPTSPRGDRTEAVMRGLISLTEYVGKSEITNGFPPRRVSAYKLFVVLTAAIQQPERPLSLTTSIQSSSVWTMLKLSGTKKKGADKELPTQLALLNGAFQVARHIPSLENLDSLLPQFVQGAFLPNRHAAAICLRLFDIVPLKVVDAFYDHVGVASFSLNTSDPLATIYILKLCGKIARLPVSSKKSNVSSTQNLLDFSIDFNAKPVKRQEKVIPGPAIDAHKSSRVLDLLLDICMQKHTFAFAATPTSPTNASAASTYTTLAPCSVLLTAIQEMALGQFAPKCFEKARSGLSPFEIASNGMQLIIQTHVDNQLVLQRVARSVQIVAECLDLCLVEYTSGGGHLDFFSKLTGSMWEISELPQYPSCLIKESLIALVWLLPRGSTIRTSLSPKSQSESNAWNRFLTHLRQLTFVPVLERGEIIQAMYRRAKLFDLDVVLLNRTIGILLHWYRQQPCQWHGDAMIQLWTTLFSTERGLQSFAVSTDLFASLVNTLDHHCSPSLAVESGAVRYMKCLALRYITLSLSKLLVHPSMKTSCLDVLLRLTKFTMLEESIIRRLSVEAILSLFESARQIQQHELSQHILQILKLFETQPGLKDILEQSRTGQACPPMEF